MLRQRLVLTSLLVALTACSAPSIPPAEQYATISGTVVDATTNAPIANASISVNVVLTATSAANGTFTVTNIPNGPLECVASAPNYAQNTSWCAAPLSPGQKVSVTIPLTHS
jgi:hypothetical protein